MSTVETHNIPLPDGYTVVDRLGAGGYGEVWKATAPGGVEKAVKVVYGHCDEGMAEREQKALERVKSVRHPFILSIERYEIVDSRLVIVTELAEMSLQDEFQKFQTAGHLGIPRERLLGYLWDAAEALDYMVDRHSLQHLDIKPENLLVVGDHTKVADFGLVKQLATKTLNSMMGGITPLYSAPEIFDDNPSSRSDQYSLAIVYQHLLTDSLPFPGRTPAQLAKQHTLATPNLRPLCEADRKVVARALAKDPAERYANCREFISALKTADSDRTTPSSYSVGGSVDAASKPPTHSDTLPVAELDTEAIDVANSTTATQVLSSDGGLASPENHSTETAHRAPVRAPFPAVDPKITDVDLPEISPETESTPVPTLFIGVGGLGVRMLRSVSSNTQESELAGETPKAWLAIDTDRDSLNGDRTSTHHEQIAHEDKLHIPLRRPKQYRDSSQSLLRWVSRRWLYNIPRSLQTRGFRPLGRIAAVDHAEQILTAIQSRLASISEPGNDSEIARSARVVILAGMSGGTGGGTLIDLAQAVRALSREASLEISVHGVLGSTYEIGSADSLAAANMFSLLTELNHSQLEGNRGESTPAGAASLFESHSRPFDEVYAVELPKQGSAECEAKLQSIAHYLLLDADKRTAHISDQLRAASDHSKDNFSLRTLDCVDLRSLSEELTQTQRQRLIQSVTGYWLQESSAELGNTGRCFGQHASSNFAKLVLDHYPEIPRVETEGEEDKEFVKATQKRNADVKQVAYAFAEHLQSCMTTDLVEVDPQVREIGDCVVAEFVALIREQQLSEAELPQKFSEILLKALTGASESLLEVNPAQIARTALSHSDSGPLECGHDRYSLLLLPEHQNGDVLQEAQEEECRTVESCSAAISQQFLIREGYALRPLDLGARLAETFPDVDEAAGRLQTRSDVDWHDLRVSLPTAAAL